MTDNTEPQATDEQTSSAEQSQTDSQRGPDRSQASEQTSELKEIKDLPAWAQKQIRDARKDAETARKQVQTFEDANKTELQKREDTLKATETRADAAEQRLRDANARSAVTEAASKANAISTRAVYALIREDLDFDEDGEPTNVAALLKKAQADEPSLFKASAGSGDGGAGGESGSKQDLNSLFRQMASQR